MLNILITVLIIEFVFSLVLFDRDVLAPAVMLSLVFLVAALDLSLMVEFWAVNLTIEAVKVITIGNAGFIITTALIHGLSKKKTVIKQETDVIILDDNTILLIDIIYIITIILYLFFVVKAAMRYGAAGNILAMVGFVKSLSANVNIGIPSILMTIYNLCINLTYIWIYIFVRNLGKVKLNFQWIILILLSLSMGILVGGSRGEFVALIISAITIYMIMYRKENTQKIPFKYYLKIGVICILILLIFQGIATIMGRDSHLYDFVEYLSIYIGAPIMNFSNAIKRGMPYSSIKGGESFHKLITFLGPILGIGEYKTSRAFWVANGHNVGNVATMYYDYYCDWGLAGAIIIPIIMAFMLQTVYEKVKRENKNGISVLVITYAWMFFLLMRSFFSNTFIDNVFSVSFLKQLVVWYVVSRYVTRIRIKIH